MARTKSASPKVPRYIQKLLRERRNGVVKIDIGGGYNPQGDDAIVMDAQKMEGVHVVHDWDVFPWPFPDNCATIIIASHVVEHVNPNAFGFIKWMNECWRILKVGGQIAIATPYAGSPGYWADPTHVNGCTHHTWRYFDPHSEIMYKIYQPKPWRIKNCFWSPEGNMEVLMEKRKEGER